MTRILNGLEGRGHDIIMAREPEEIARAAVDSYYPQFARLRDKMRSLKEQAL
jgi:hypothetical protein